MNHETDPNFVHVDEWRRRIKNGEVKKLVDYPWETNWGFSIVEFVDMLEMFGSDEEEEKQAWLEKGNQRFRETIYRAPFLITSRIKEAIDAIPGEFIYLHTDYDSEEQFEGIISLMKMMERCSTASGHGFSDGEDIREFSSSAEVVAFLEEKYAALKTYHECGTAAEILAAGSFTVDYLRTQMLKEKLTSLKVRLGESGEEIELPVTTVRAENDCDCYRVEIKETALEGWLMNLRNQGAPLVYEVINGKTLEIRIRDNR
jgi:hypothetical protein